MVSHQPLIPGGRRAFVAATGLFIILVAAGIFAAILLLGPSTTEREEKRAWLETEVRQAFGEDLGSVQIRSQRTGIWEVTYRGVFSLKGIPLKFEFRPTHDELEFYGLSASALVDNRVIGGSERFIKLARRYHEDFPDEPTLYYWFIEDQSHLPDGLLAVLLARHPGPSVIVKNENDYWSHRSARTLGVYSWDASRDDWELIHRGRVE